MGENQAFSRQQQRILDYIADFGSITAGEAHIDLGILNFSARLSELKDKGIRFKSKRETAKNRYQEPVSYYRYSFYEEKDCANCVYYNTERNDMPCCSCNGHSNFESEVEGE